MNKSPLPPLSINPTASSSSAGRDRRPSSAIYIGSGFPSSAIGVSSPLPPLSLASPLPGGPLSSLSPASPANSISTSISQSQSHSQLPSPPSTTAGSTGSVGDGDGDRCEGGMGTRRLGVGQPKTGLSSTLEGNNKIGSRLLTSLGLGSAVGRDRDRNRGREDGYEFDGEIDEEQLSGEELDSGDHTARHRTGIVGRNGIGRKAESISMGMDTSASGKPLNSGSETERERERERPPSRVQVRAHTPERRHSRSSSDSNANVSMDNDNEATPPATGRRTVRNGEHSPRKQATTFSVIGSGRRTRTVSILEKERDEVGAPTPGPGPSTLTNRRARAPLPREFRGDRLSVSSELDGRSTSDVHPETPSIPSSPRRARDSRASTLREARKTKRINRLSLGESRSWEQDREQDQEDVNESHSVSSHYGGRRATVRQGGSAESALARERREGSLRGLVPERSVVGEGFRAAGLSRRSTVAGHVRSQNPPAIEDSPASTSTTATATAIMTSTSRRRHLPPNDNDDDTASTRTPASRYSTVRLGMDDHRLPSSTHQVRAATSMAVYRDREDDRPLSAVTSRRTLRSSLSGDRERDRDRPPSTLRFTPLSEPRPSERVPRGASPFVQSHQQQASLPPAASNAGTEHTRLLLDALQIFESHLSKPFPPSSSSSSSPSTLLSTFPDLQAHATTLVQSAHVLNELLRTSTSRALESQIEAEIGDAPPQVDAGEMWRMVGAEYREGLRVSDDLVRVITALLIAFGRVMRDVAKRAGGPTTTASNMDGGGERERDLRTESPDVGGGSVISSGTGASSGQRSERSRHSLDHSLRVRPIRRSTGMEGISLPSHASGEGRRSVDLVSPPPASLAGRRSAELGVVGVARARESEERERITGRRSMDGVSRYVSHTHSSSAETLKRERAILDVSRPSTSLSFVRRDREKINHDDGEGNQDEGDETARDTRRDKERRATLDRLSLRRTFMPRLRDGIPADLRLGSGNSSANSSRVDLNHHSETPRQSPGLSQTNLHLLAQAQAQDSPTPAPRVPSTLNSKRPLAMPPPLPSLPSESLFNRHEDDNNNINSASPLTSFPPSAPLSTSGPGPGSIRRRPKFSNTSITTVRGSISGLGSSSVPILSPSTSVPTTAVSNDEIEIKGGRSTGGVNGLTGNSGTTPGGTGSTRIRSGTLSLRDLQERDRITRERLGQTGTGERERETERETGVGSESREHDASRNANTLRKRAFSSASNSQLEEDSNLRHNPSTLSISTSTSASTQSRIRTLRSRTRPRMSLDDVQFDGDGTATTHMREVSSPAALGTRLGSEYEYEYERN